MNAFQLDERLQNDCEVLLEQDRILYLLHRNAEVNWFILVPRVSETEFFQLDAAWQSRLLKHINHLSGFVESHFKIDKINVATIGNVVSQLHIHVIGRRKDDAYWPDVVWGKPALKSWSEEEVDSIKTRLLLFLEAPDA